MSSPVTMMKLHASRAAQIRALADAKGIGGTEALEHMLNVAIRAGELPDVLPGWEVFRDGDRIGLHIEGAPIPSMDAEMALLVAEDLEHAATAMTHGKGRPRWYGAESWLLVVGRHGTGVVVGFEETPEGAALGTGEKIRGAMTRGMAADLARQIRKAVHSA